jgi:hypothetical protein
MQTTTYCNMMKPKILTASILDFLVITGNNYTSNEVDKKKCYK